MLRGYFVRIMYMGKNKSASGGKKLSIKIITLFPNFIEDFMENFGIVRKAIKNKLLQIKPVDLREFGIDKRGTVDGRPYGGGVGMVLRADVLYGAICSVKRKAKSVKQRIILLTPQGKVFNQKIAERLAKYDNLVLVCGRYEGFDERIRQSVDEEISIGDYVLMGGELPALVIAEAVMRLRKGVLGKDESSRAESFSDGLLEYPQYTKPEILRLQGSGRRAQILRVPEVLLTGHHKKIKEWRRKEALRRTKKRRPGLFNEQK